MVLPDWIINFLRNIGILKKPVSEQAEIQENLRELNRQQEGYYNEWMVYAKKVETLEADIKQIPTTGSAGVLRIKAKHDLARLQGQIQDVVNAVNGINTRIALLEKTGGLGNTLEIGEKILRENARLQEKMARAEYFLEQIEDAQTTLTDVSSGQYNVKDPLLKEDQAQEVSGSKVAADANQGNNVSEIDAGRV